MTFRNPLIPLLTVGLYVAGCTQSAPREGPASLAAVRVEDGRYEGQPAKRVVTAHYVIHTTIEDEAFVESLGQLMEGALTQYRRFVPDVPVTTRPMLCHVFAIRSEWAGFTKDTAGPDAEVYLQINRGGYTAGDSYVAYFLGDVGTWSVASHEGWHQFVARHFKRRPPPFLEEGLACLFEDVAWKGDLPRWDLASNHTRLNGIRKTLERGALIPLDRLCTMHAGQVVNTTPAQIEAFYAESWAFARFCWDGEGGRYRAGLQRMLGDLAAGDPVALALTGPRGAWDPTAAKPLLEHYLGQELRQIEPAFVSYLREIAKE